MIRTGNNTFIGSIATNVTGTSSESSSLRKEVKAFVTFIAILALIMAIAFFVMGIIRIRANLTQEKVLAIFINGFIIVIVANVPQGLPATVTSCLTIIARRLGDRNVYIKQLECLETLGSATVIASDKTGTLTTNVMTVENLWSFGSKISAEKAQKTKVEQLQVKAFRKIFKVASLCNRAFIERTVQEVDSS